MTTVYMCSNPGCGALWDTDPCRHCPACTTLTDFGWKGWSTRAVQIRSTPELFEERAVPEWDRPFIGLPHDSGGDK